ncbi:MAG: leucine-rich repeat protein, partial [Oscillospiraceae bacterium]|nr:leucine-rich repeat protein [Oscillospiraceae bacterium]
MKTKILLKTLICECLAVAAAILLITSFSTPYALAAGDDFIIDKKGILTEFKGSGTEAIIPKEVTAIGDAAFSGNQRLKKVVIPEGVTEIGKRSFYKCTGLQEIFFPSSLTAIGD